MYVRAAHAASRIPVLTFVFVDLELMPISRSLATVIQHVDIDIDINLATSVNVNNVVCRHSFDSCNLLQLVAGTTVRMPQRQHSCNSTTRAVQQTLVHVLVDACGVVGQTDCTERAKHCQVPSSHRATSRQAAQV